MGSYVLFYNFNIVLWYRNYVDLLIIFFLLYLFLYLFKNNNLLCIIFKFSYIFSIYSKINNNGYKYERNIYNMFILDSK